MLVLVRLDIGQHLTKKFNLLYQVVDVFRSILYLISV